MSQTPELAEKILQISPCGQRSVETIIAESKVNRPLNLKPTSWVLLHFDEHQLSIKRMPWLAGRWCKNCPNFGGGMGLTLMPSSSKLTLLLLGLLNMSKVWAMSYVSSCLIHKCRHKEVAYPRVDTRFCFNSIQKNLTTMYLPKNVQHINDSSSPRAPFLKFQNRVA